jgi:hypothetical protein
MVMFSQLRRFELTDGEGRRARLTDVAVALLDADYPPVTRLFFLNETKKKGSLSWSEVRDFKPQARRIVVRDLEKAQPESSVALAKEVLLCDDILDALVLDLQNRLTCHAVVGGRSGA